LLTHAEIFRNIVISSIKPNHKNWDNLASGPREFGKTGGVLLQASTFEECVQACEVDINCLQYVHHGDTCHIGSSLRLDHEMEADEQGIWQSGWNQTRLNDWMSSQIPCDHNTF
jgi:hypothetical protein